MYFSAPLYRKNLHYSVLPKPDSFADVIKVTREFILEKHANQSGIIYCLSKKVRVRKHQRLPKDYGLICRPGCRACGERAVLGKQRPNQNGDIPRGYT